MKKIILIIAFISISVLSKAQCDLPYKPLSEFNKDTTAFIIYNFMDRAEYYKGKTIKEITKDLGIPIKYYTRDFSGNGTLFTGIDIYIYDDITVDRLRNSQKDYNAIYILWENKISRDDTKYQNFEKSHPKWEKGAYDYVKDMRIKEISVVIPDYSKYYKKYNKETKTESTKRRGVFNF